jgi:hypothetical protein
MNSLRPSQRIDTSKLSTTIRALVARDSNGENMALNFPNSSRSYDETRHAVRFWGYESAMEVSFFVTVDALSRLEVRPLADEAAVLAAFDAHCERIRSAAGKAFAGPKKGSYELGVGNFG